jgi:hypothetical protein
LHTGNICVGNYFIFGTNPCNRHKSAGTVGTDCCSEHQSAGTVGTDCRPEQQTSKPAILETGLETKVPLFISQGKKIKVDTRSRILRECDSRKQKTVCDDNSRKEYKDKLLSLWKIFIVNFYLKIYYV